MGGNAFSCCYRQVKILSPSTLFLDSRDSAVEKQFCLGPFAYASPVKLVLMLCSLARLQNQLD